MRICHDGSGLCALLRLKAVEHGRVAAHSLLTYHSLVVGLDNPSLTHKELLSSARILAWIQRQFSMATELRDRGAESMPAGPANVQEIDQQADRESITRVTEHRER
jgi:hypothetical protein